MEITVAGCRIYAATGGKPFDPGRPAVLFVHGAGMDHTVWQLQARYFAHHGRSVLAVDLPGHGRSEGPPSESVLAYADWLASFLDAVGCSEAALVGHSMGALVALAMAARFPERVRALALLGVAARMPVHPDLLAAADAGDPLAIELITAWGYGKPAHLGGHRAPGLWMLGGGKRLLERSAAGVLASDFRACDAYQDAAAAAARISCPALILSGAADRMTPPKAAATLAAAIPHAKSIVLPLAGHMMMVEAPDETLDALRGIL
ncbi:MAG TPA: alpha/beta hydrolase [Alphaproteobacteria bacterium]|nr:alpha/beta hydrolase [Alphaproteobacteria bacterium]